LPLTIEELTSKKGQARFELSISYINNENKNTDLLSPPENSSDNPTNQPFLGQSLSNSDILISTATIRYGLTKSTELYTRFSGKASEYRANNYRQKKPLSTQSNHFSSAWIGLNHSFRNDLGNKPAILGFSELQIAQKTGEDSSTVYGKSLVLGVTTYQTIDPIVLSLTTAIQLNDERKEKRIIINPGNSIQISPSVGFSANDKVTLTTGFSWQRRTANDISNQDKSIKKTNTALNLGLGYALSKKNTLSVNIQHNISEGSGAQLGALWAYKLGNKNQ
jgi:hypothetical protein